MADDSFCREAHHGFTNTRISNGRHCEDRTDSQEYSRSQSSKSNPNLTILQLNVEGISKDKCHFLAKLCTDRKVDVILLQETHTSNQEQLIYRGLIHNYQLIDSVNSAVHGIATYIKNDITNYQNIYGSNVDGIFVIIIKVYDLFICNLYKPPNIQWPDNFPVIYDHPSIYLGDFNCHHNLWGYEQNDNNGISLCKWMENNNFHLHFNAKDKNSFYSARWRKEYNPDLCITSTDENYQPLLINKEVLSEFPHSQHRPVLVKMGINIEYIETLKKPRWNFQKANWKEFSRLVDCNLRWVKPSYINYHRFVGVIKSSAKKTIPRGFRDKYIPCWSEHIQRCYDEYQKQPCNDKANEILNLLNQARKEKWNELMKDMNFTHSSRRGWSLLNKLGNTNQPKKRSPNVNANSIASRIVDVSNSVSVSKAEVREIRQLRRRQQKSAIISEDLCDSFEMGELVTAIKSLKNRKAAGFDGVFPEFFKNLGSFSTKWLLTFFNDIFVSGNIPNDFRKTKVIAVLKPGKPEDNPSSYRPISLLSVGYKLLEKLLYNRLMPLVDENLPNEQGGFRPNRNSCDQVLSLTTHIESGFQQHFKTGAVFLDLSAAYDTVWKNGLLYKLHETVHCCKTVNLIENLLSNRKIKVFLNETSSRYRILNNGLPQGSVLSPLLFNIYLSDLPVIKSRKFIYADDIVLTFQSKSFESIEENLAFDLEKMNNFFRKWRLCLNPSKTEVACFHLFNQQKHRQLQINLDGIPMKHNFNPAYLGVTLDTSLNYNHHLEKLKQKLKTRNNLLCKLAGTTWGANARTLRTTALALIYSSAEYCSPVWQNSSHVTRIDTQLNTTMRLISGTISSTPTSWLPILSNIHPPCLRRQRATKLAWDKYRSLPEKFTITADIENPPPTKLKSRKPLWLEDYLYKPLNIDKEWKTKWETVKTLVYNGDLIKDPTMEVNGLDLSRKIWVMTNRLRTGHGKCNSMLFKWKLVPSAACLCGHPSQTIEHIVKECPRTKFNGDFTAIHSLVPEAIEWIQHLEPL